MKIFVTLLLVILLPVQALASNLKYVPDWTPVKDGIFYDLEGAKKLLLIDAEMEKLKKDEANFKKSIEEYKAAVELYKKADETRKQELKEADRYSYELLTKYQICVKDKYDAEARASSSFAWTVAGAVLLLGAGVGIGLAVSK